MIIVLVVLHLVVLHTVDGHEVMINPEHVTVLHVSKPDEQNKLMTDEVACVVGLANGKFVSVAESCELVRQQLEEVR